LGEESKALITQGANGNPLCKRSISDRRERYEVNRLITETCELATKTPKGKISDSASIGRDSRKQRGRSKSFIGSRRRQRGRSASAPLVSNTSCTAPGFQENRVRFTPIIRERLPDTSATLDARCCPAWECYRGYIYSKALGGQSDRQYSSGSRMVVTDRSASVMIQMRVPSSSSWAENTRALSRTARRVLQLVFSPERAGVQVHAVSMVRLRVKSLGTALSHIKPLRDHFGRAESG
jgi:hypothetical protein